MVLKKMMSALNVEKVVIGIPLFAILGLENVPIDHHQQEGDDIQIQDQGINNLYIFLDIEDQEDLIQDHAHILLIHHLIQEGEEIQRREADTIEEVEVQEETTRERKVPVVEDHKAIQDLDLQLAINNVSQISHLHLNEKGSN